MVSRSERAKILQDLKLSEARGRVSKEEAYKIRSELGAITDRRGGRRNKLASDLVEKGFSVEQAAQISKDPTKYIIESKSSRVTDDGIGATQTIDVPSSLSSESPYSRTYIPPEQQRSYLIPEERKIQTFRNEQGRIVGIQDPNARMSYAARQGEEFSEKEIQATESKREQQLQDTRMTDMLKQKKEDKNLFGGETINIKPSIPEEIYQRYEVLEKKASGKFKNLITGAVEKGIIQETELFPKRKTASFLDLPIFEKISGYEWAKKSNNESIKPYEFVTEIPRKGELISYNIAKGAISGVQDKPLFTAGSFALGFAGAAGLEVIEGVGGLSATIAKGGLITGGAIYGVQKGGEVLSQPTLETKSRKAGEILSTEIIPSGLGGFTGSLAFEYTGNPIRTAIQKGKPGYIPIEESGFKVTPSVTEEYSMSEITGMAGKKVDGIHTSYSDIFGTKSETTIQAFPENVGGLRKEIGQFSFYKSLPEKATGKPQAYTAYIGIDDGLSTGESKFKLSFGEPKRYVYSFADEQIEPISALEFKAAQGNKIAGAKKILSYQNEGTGKSYIPAENIVGLSTEGQYTTPVGSVLKKVSSGDRFTIYQEPSKISNPLLRNIQEKTSIGLKRYELKLVDVVTLPGENMRMQAQPMNLIPKVESVKSISVTPSSLRSSAIGLSASVPIKSTSISSKPMSSGSISSSPISYQKLSSMISSRKIISEPTISSSPSKPLSTSSVLSSMSRSTSSSPSSSKTSSMISSSSSPSSSIMSRGQSISSKSISSRPLSVSSRMIPLNLGSISLSGQSQYYNVYALNNATKKANYVKVNQLPLPREKALSLGSNAVDQTVSARFKITPTTVDNRDISKINKYAQTIDLPNKVSTKFQDFKVVKGQQVKMNDIFIEKTNNRIDSRGEHEGITVMGWVAKRNKVTSKSRRQKINLFAM